MCSVAPVLLIYDIIFVILSKNRPDPARPSSRFWDAYYSETINFRENNYQIKNVYPNHKYFVLKFGNDPMNEVLGRPYFVRVIFFPFLAISSDLVKFLNFWKRHSKELLKTYQMLCTYLHFFLLECLKNWNFMKKWHFSLIFFYYFPFSFQSYQISKIWLFHRKEHKNSM